VARLAVPLQGDVEGVLHLQERIGRVQVVGPRRRATPAVPRGLGVMRFRPEPDAVPG